MLTELKLLCMQNISNLEKYCTVSTVDYECNSSLSATSGAFSVSLRLDRSYKHSLDYDSSTCLMATPPCSWLAEYCHSTSLLHSSSLQHNTRMKGMKGGLNAQDSLHAVWAPAHQDGIRCISTATAMPSHIAAALLLWQGT